MKFGMVACINIVYMENLSTAGTGDRQKLSFADFVFFTRFRPFGIDLQKKKFSVKMPALMTGENKILQIDTKWSEMRKKHKTDDAEFLPVAYGSLY